MSLKLSQLPDPTLTATTVMIDETVSGTTTSVQYLNLGVDDSGKVRLLRCNTSGSEEMNSTSVAHYQDCKVDVYLNDETSTGYLSRLDSATRNALSSTSIKVKDETDGTIYEIARRCFLLSYTELGSGDGVSEGASILDVLKKWKNTTNAMTARIATGNSGTAVEAWLRSPYDNTQFRICLSNGAIDGNYATRIRGLRPVLSFNPDTLVTDPDENGVCYLLPDPDKPYREAGIENFVLGTQTNMPTQAKIFLTAKGCMTNYPEVEITANFDDSTPVWLPVTMIAGTTDSNGYTSYSGVVNFNDITPEQGVTFAINIYARTESQCRISQPVIAPA